ncbi:nucleoside diphosphate kinase regulator [Mesorhizobium retamae]|uniref:Nucleoside diphosphate kinase regulator n=1 Tax=Mesorhizobium retamae TaxID=2912854 RepID=A0ABS9QBF2_9HYPH|nr:nucleoside diphosphate kinase regulator [Mesorhizobium sp. IRAMC:0171]MCG7504141.1 nucleoside diphosphate kinase regulator [Mesorhizobium sp. IRAMC:0171]
MQRSIKVRPPDTILVSATDHGRLTGLARASLDRLPDTAEELLSEMDRATVATAGALPDNVVRMGSTIVARNGGGAEQRMTLVYPADADIAAQRISVLTPLGTALIGAQVGHCVQWTTRDGREMMLDIVEVLPPHADRT